MSDFCVLSHCASPAAATWSFPVSRQLPSLSAGMEWKLPSLQFHDDSCVSRGMWAACFFARVWPGSGQGLPVFIRVFFSLLAFMCAELFSTLALTLSTGGMRFSSAPICPHSWAGLGPELCTSLASQEPWFLHKRAGVRNTFVVRVVL